VKECVSVSLWFVGSEVLTAVVMKSIIFWDITPCSQLKVNRRFGAFPEVISTSGCMKSNNRGVNVLRIGKDVEGSGRGLI
jgi:hypothetical protein